MKQFLLVLAMVLLPILANAAPFVVCDPYLPTEVQPTSFVVVLDVDPAVSVPPVAGAGGLILKYDVGTVAVGPHTIKVKACLYDITWGEACSAEVPFTFTRPASPLVPRTIILLR